MQSAKIIEKVSGMSKIGKISVPLETWNCASNIELHPVSFCQSASSQPLLVQANKAVCKLGFLRKTEFEYLLAVIDNKIWNLDRSGLWSKKSNSLNNHCGFASKASQKSGNLGLLHFNCILVISRIRQLLLLLICIQGWITPLFLAQSYQ